MGIDGRLFNDVEITKVFRNMDSLPDSYAGNLQYSTIKKLVIYTSQVVSVLLGRLRRASQVGDVNRMRKN
jgi:hypothetical protein